MSDTMEIQVKDLQVGDVITHWENWDGSMIKGDYGPWTVTKITSQGMVKCTSTNEEFVPTFGSDEDDLRVRIVARASMYANATMAKSLETFLTRWS